MQSVSISYNSSKFHVRWIINKQKIVAHRSGRPRIVLSGCLSISISRSCYTCNRTRQKEHL